MLELAKKKEEAPAPGSGAGAGPAPQGSPGVPPDPLQGIKPVRPEDLGKIKPELPPAKKPEAKKRGQARGTDLVLNDVKVPLAKLVKAITGVIAENARKPAIVATEEEARDIEEAFDAWVNYRFPKIKGAVPELILVMAILSYLVRVANDINKKPAPAPAIEAKK